MNTKTEKQIKNELFQYPIIPVEEPTAVYAEIDGYWKDDETAFTGYLVKLQPTPTYLTADDNGDLVLNEEENVFYYFQNQEELEAEFLMAHQTNLDFVITGYKLFEE